MDEVLSNWSTATQGPKPKVVILVPTGQNPSGTTMSIGRRKVIYGLARKHDLIIISDDPYRALVLNFSDDGKAAPAAPSFLEIDSDARVVDLSSFSKIVAPGCRCGWITGPSQLLERFAYRSEVTTQSISGFSLAAITSFIGAIGGQEGWEKYLEHCSLSYSDRARRMEALFREHLPLEVVSWVTPKAGMFYFIRLKAAAHPRIAELGPDGVLLDVFETGIANGVTTAPSDLFRADPSVPTTVDDIFLRCSFSYTTPKEMAEGARRLGHAIRESFGL
jgi:aromatic amino acid aminotransferase I